MVAHDLSPASGLAATGVCRRRVKKESGEARDREDVWEEVSLESLRSVYCALKRTPECGYLAPAATQAVS
jgi:hypothetical protein